jgi:hypothetical protein
MKMPTFSDDKVTFIHIPKTAGASITRWYLKNILHISDICNYKYEIGEHLFLNEIENPAPITFAVIRNPWDRVVSMYSFIIKIHVKYCSKLTFEEFINKIIKTMTFGNHKLSTPQIRWIEPGVTHLLRFENLDNDFKNIQDIFQCYEPLPFNNKSDHEHYRTYYNDETRRAVTEMFKEDIEAFGYEF